MGRTHLWTWAIVVCLFSAPIVCAQSQPASDGSAAPASVAAVPRLIKFSGAVRDARGEPLGNVAVRLTFAVYSEQQGGAALWAETQMVQLDEQGHYAVLLGATRADGLPVELFPAGKARWLGVQVEGRDEDSRVLLVSVPYALKAEDAAMLGGRQASDFVLGEQLKEEVKTQVAAQTPGIATQAVEMLTGNPPKAPAMTIVGPATIPCATSGNCLTVQQTGTGRAMSTSAVSSTDVVYVQQTGTGYGLWALATGNVAVYGQITGSAGTSYGVKGQTTSTTGAGVFGYNLATTGLAYGILGQTKSTEGTALFGRAVSTIGGTIGVRGHADSTSGTGIVGQATATSGTTTGILGRVFSLDGTALIVDNTKGGKLLSGKVGSLEKFSVSGSGNVVASGSVTATSFSGGGSGLTGVNAATAVTATSAGTATNAQNLEGVAAANYARRDTSNTFTGNQTVNGSLTVNGTVTGTAFVGDGSGLTVNGATVAALLAKIRDLQGRVDYLTPPGGRLWVNRFGGSEYAIGQAIAVDLNGDVLVTTQFLGTVDFGGGPLTSVGALTDIFVAKFSGVDGAHLWSKRFGGMGYDIGSGIAADGSGNVLVTGCFQDTADFGGGPRASHGSYDIFVAKFSGVDGAHLWSKGFGSTYDDMGLGIAADGSGVVVTGYFRGAVSFGGGGLTSAGAMSEDIFVVKLSGANGAHLWSKQFGDVGPDEGHGIAVDGTGSVLVTGDFSGTVDFGGGPLTSAGGYDIFVARLSGVNGAHLWSKRFGGTGTDSACALAADGSGNVLVTGYFERTLDFGGGGLTSAGGGDIFVSKFSGGDGAHLWSKRFGDTLGDRGYGITADRSGNALVTGLFSGTVDFGGEVLTSAGTADIFVLKLRR
ncbi:MAG: SBBP repeat-containing protein [Terriglobia bacterium]